MAEVLWDTYTIDDWPHWDDQINAAVGSFRRRFTLFPNLLVASEATHARIDMAAAKDKIRDEDGRPVEEGEHTPISSFCGAEYELSFCIDERLPTGTFALVYDEDPNGGGEPVPDEEDPEESSPVDSLAG